MTASLQTVKDIHAILRAYLSDADLSAMLVKLSEVPGNRSFTDTVKRLQSLHRNRDK